jgi:RNA polymerase sigma-70 factor (ECF subfamily)
MRDESERNLIEHCSSPDPSVREGAFSDLYRRYVDRIYRLALRVTGNDAEARDVTQEAFLRAFQRIDRFRAEAAFSSWMHRIAVNIAIDRHRRAARRPAVPLESEDAPAAPLPGRGDRPDPGTEAAGRERADAVRSLVASLSPRLAAVVVLRYGEGLAYEEIADLLGIPLGTVKSRLNRAHDLLAPGLRPWR